MRGVSRRIVIVASVTERTNAGYDDAAHVPAGPSALG